MKITLVMPDREDDAWQADRARLVTKIGELAGMAVDRVHGDLRQAPATGFVVTDANTLSHAGEDVEKSLGERLVVLEADKSTMREVLGAYRPAALIEVMDFFSWRTGGGGGFMGLAELGRRLGAKVSRVYPYDPYRPLFRDAPNGMPGLLADYLKEYQKLLQLPE